MGNIVHLVLDTALDGPTAVTHIGDLGLFPCARVHLLSGVSLRRLHQFDRVRKVSLLRSASSIVEILHCLVLYSHISLVRP